MLLREQLRLSVETSLTYPYPLCRLRRQLCRPISASIHPRVYGPRSAVDGRQLFCADHLQFLCGQPLSGFWSVFCCHGSKIVGRQSTSSTETQRQILPTWRSLATNTSNSLKKTTLFCQIHGLLSV